MPISDSAFLRATVRAPVLFCAAFLASACDPTLEVELDVQTESRLAGSSASLQGLQEQVDELALPLIEDHVSGAIVVGVIDSSGWATFSYGRKSLEDPTPPDERTLFEIGSITKTFTGLLLAQGLASHPISLSEPIDRYLPGVRLPSPGGQRVTLEALATHTSGLPRMPTDWHDGYTQLELFDYLNQYPFLQAPESMVQYSNLGAGLTGMAIETIEHARYEDVLRRNICDPLGMPDTRVGLNSSQIQRIAIGWNRDFEPRQMLTWILTGAGSIKSTPLDLLRYAGAYAGLVPVSDSLKAAMAEAIRPRRTYVPSINIGLYWLSYENQSIWFHDGVTEYTSMLAFDPVRKIAVAVMSTKADAHKNAGPINHLAMGALELAGAIQPSGSAK